MMLYFSRISAKSRRSLYLVAGLALSGCGGDDGAVGEPRDGSSVDGSRDSGLIDAGKDRAEATVTAEAASDGGAVGDDGGSTDGQLMESSATDGGGMSDAGRDSEAASRDSAETDRSVPGDAPVTEMDTGSDRATNDGADGKIVETGAGGSDGADDVSIGKDANDAGGDASPTDGGSVEETAKDGEADATPDKSQTSDGPAEMDATADSACTPPPGGTFQCGATTCNGATSYCLAGMIHDSCEPLPPECACAETFGCACLLAQVKNPCDVGSLTCIPMHDGGIYWIQAIACP